MPSLEPPYEKNDNVGQSVNTIVAVILNTEQHIGSLKRVDCHYFSYTCNVDGITKYVLGWSAIGRGAVQLIKYILVCRRSEMRLLHYNLNQDTLINCTRPSFSFYNLFSMDQLLIKRNFLFKRRFNTLLYIRLVWGVYLLFIKMTDTFLNVQYF